MEYHLAQYFVWNDDNGKIRNRTGNMYILTDNGEHTNSRYLMHWGHYALRFEPDYL